jgi:arylsulfatase A-like enzyme/tetratricopeptide (TPR) repeat protein
MSDTSFDSKSDNEECAYQGASIPNALGATPERVASLRPSGTRRAGIAALLLVAAFVVWAGWRLVPHRVPSVPDAKASGPAAAANSSTRNDAIRNVLLISIDTCRSDRLSCYGYKRTTTPNIDAVARDGALFKMALTPVPLTTPAHSSMFTGTYPPTHGVHLNTYDHLAPLSPDGKTGNVTLATILRQAGYQTAAFVAAFPLDSRFGLNQGFDTYDGSFSTESTEGERGIFSHRDGEQVNRPALSWLEKHAKQPFFMFLHYYDTHHPYKPHAPCTLLYADDPYAGEIAYVDICIGQVLDRLRGLGLYDNTLLIITGDHGEALGEHGEKTHSYFIYQGTLHVPLVIRAPGCSKGIHFAGNVSLVDIVPTVLDSLGLNAPARVEGVSLRKVLEGTGLPSPFGSGAGGEGVLQPSSPQPVYAESLFPATFGCSPLHGIVEGPWKYILAPRQELYDLAHDPGETTNLAAQQPQVAGRLRAQLVEMLKNSDMAAPGRSKQPVDPEAVKRLESLGYVGGGVAPPLSALDTTREDPKEFLPIFSRFMHGRDLFYHGHHNPEARKELMDIAALRPAIIEPHKLLAEIDMEEHQPAEAAEQCSKLLGILGESKGPGKQLPGATEELADAHSKLGLALQEMGKTPEAIGHFEEALRIKPDFVEPHLALGLALRQTGKLPEAIAQVEQALRIDPNAAKGHLNLGVSLQQAGRLTEAIGHFDQSLRIKPDFAEPHLALALTLRQMGKLPEAISEFEQFLRMKPDNAEAHVGLSLTLQQAGKLPEAIAQCEEAQRIEPNNAQWLVSLGLVLQQAGKLPEAIAQYEKALRIKPELASSGPRLDSVLATLRRAMTAIEGYQDRLRTKPDDAEAHNNLANLLRQVGCVPEAIAHYRQALRSKPEDPAIHYNMAVALGMDGNLAEAAAHYAEALKLKPDLVDALNNLAWIRATSGDAGLRDGGEAVRLAERACQLGGSRQSGLLDTLAAAYAEAGRFAKAVAAAQEAIALARSANKPVLADRIQTRLDRYRAGQTYRETPTKR